MLDCQSSSLNAVFGREVRIQMLEMAVLHRQEGVEKITPIAAIKRWGLPKLNGVDPMLTPLFYHCKPDANKKAKPKLRSVL